MESGAASATKLPRRLGKTPVDEREDQSWRLEDAQTQKKTGRKGEKRSGMRI
jgi:hypothetical protein